MKFIAKQDVTLTSLYGTFTFRAGDVTEFEPIVRQFSQYFVELFEPKIEVEDETPAPPPKKTKNEKGEN